MQQPLDPNEIDSLTARLRGFVVAAFSDTVARECTAARAAEVERLHQAANLILKETPYNDPTLGGLVSRAFDELFRRVDDPLVNLNQPFRPDGRLGGFAGGAAELRQARGEGGIYPNLPASNPLPTAAHSRTALDKVSRGTPVFGSGPAKPEVSYDAISAGARYDDMSPEAVAERARLQAAEQRTKGEAQLRADERAENAHLAHEHGLTEEDLKTASDEAEKAAQAAPDPGSTSI